MSAIQELQIRLQGTNALIARYRVALDLPTTTPLEAKALKLNMRALQNLATRLETEFLEHAAAEKLEVYKYRLLTGDESPSLAGVGEAWSKLQNLYATVYRSLTHTSIKVVEAVLAAPQLGFAYSFPGSVGVVVTLPPKPAGEVLLTASPIDEASEIVFNLIESKDIQGIAQKLGPAPIQAMNEWLEVHVKHHYGIAIEWQADKETKRKSEVKYSEMTSLQTAVQETKTRQTSILTGLLSKVDIDNKTFRLKSDSGDAIEGRYEENVIQEQHAASIPARYTATIVTVTEMVYTGNKRPQPEIILEKLEPL
jgi:hypothetical protein